MGKVGAFFRVEKAWVGTRHSSARFLRVLFVSVGVCPGPCLGGGKRIWRCKQVDELLKAKDPGIGLLVMAVGDVGGWKMPLRLP